MIAPHPTSPALCSLTHAYAWSHVTHNDNHNPIRLLQLQAVAELILARYMGVAMKTTDAELHPTTSRWVRSNTVSVRNLSSAARSTAVFTLSLWLLYSTRSKRSSYCTWRYLLKRGSPNDSGECCSFLHSYRRLSTIGMCLASIPDTAPPTFVFAVLHDYTAGGGLGGRTSRT